VVERIEYRDASVRVVTDRGVFDGDTVIVTLPLGVLKTGAVVFDPPLPEQKRAALQQLAMGNLTKITARFDAPFWPRDQYIFGCICEPISDYPTMLVNLWKTHRIPALQMLVGGNKGRAIERWTEDETREWVLHVLRHVFGERATQPAAIERTAWDSDPFSLGSYTYISIGGTPAAFEALAEPIEGRVLFAGEATYRHHWGCTQGAYVSGLREAAHRRRPQHLAAAPLHRKSPLARDDAAR
jgi:monoamine oxidase